jgi:hypothetical protein
MYCVQSSCMNNLYGEISVGSRTPHRLSLVVLERGAAGSCLKPQPYVPASLRLQVFQSIHNLSHPGTKATAKLVAQRFMWPGMQKDCRTWARVCQACQRSKVSRHTVTPVGDFMLPAARFLHIHIDLVGPLPTPAGYTY